MQTPPAFRRMFRCTYCKICSITTVGIECLLYITHICPTDAFQPVSLIRISCQCNSRTFFCRTDGRSYRPMLCTVYRYIVRPRCIRRQPHPRHQPDDHRQREQKAQQLSSCFLFHVKFSFPAARPGGDPIRIHCWREVMRLAVPQDAFAYANAMVFLLRAAASLVGGFVSFRRLLIPLHIADWRIPPQAATVHRAF